MCKGENHGKPIGYSWKFMEIPMTFMGKSYGFRDSLGGCHQRHRYLAAWRSFGPQTGLMAVLRGAALPVLVVDDVDDEISGVPTSFNI
jgi:hypothetical protein